MNTSSPQSKIDVAAANDQARIPAIISLFTVSSICGFGYPITAMGDGVWIRDAGSFAIAFVLAILIPVLLKTRNVQLVMRIAVVTAIACFMLYTATSGDLYYASLGLVVPVAASLFCKRSDAIFFLASYLGLTCLIIGAIEFGYWTPPYTQEQFRVGPLAETAILVLLTLAICLAVLKKEEFLMVAKFREQEADAQVQAQQRRFETVCQSAYDAILEADEFGRVIWASGGLIQKLGYCNSGILGQRQIHFVEPRDRRNVLAQARDRLNAGAYCIEVRLLSADGQCRWVRISGGRFTDADGRQRWVTAIQDTHSEVIARDRMFELSRLESLGNVCGGLAHDFNNLLTVIGIFGEMVTEDDLRRQILQAQQQAADVTSGLLTFARREQLRDQVFEFTGFLEQLRPIIEHMIPGNIECRWSIDCHGQCVRIDPSQMQQVVINLVNNASYAMAEGGGLLTITTSVRTVDGNAIGSHHVPEGTYLQLEVVDTGCGMTDEDASRAFEPFYTTKARGEGTGLGLSTVHGAVCRAGGYVAITSDLNVGTTVSVLLPAVVSVGSAATVAIPPADDQESVPESGRDRILLVDDRESLARALKIALQKAGYQVDLCFDAESAIERIQSGHAFDLLVTDIVLPGQSGVELAQRVRTLKPEMKIILISGYQQNDLSFIKSQQEISRFLPKPFSAQQLLSTVRELLNSNTDVRA